MAARGGAFFRFIYVSNFTTKLLEGAKRVGAVWLLWDRGDARTRAEQAATCYKSLMPSPDASIRLLDAVALTLDRPDYGLLRGQVGTVVETLAPGVFEVEFSDDRGRTYAQLVLRGEQLMVLHYRPQQAA